MTVRSRASVVSSFTVIKGAMIAETYAAFAGWDLSRSKRENLDRLRDQNYIGAKSATWLRDVAWVLSRRFEPNQRDLPLLTLAKSGCDMHEWRPLLLWHITRDEFLLRDFLVNWLFPAFDEGTFRIRPDELRNYLETLRVRGGTTEHGWSESTADRVAAGLLKMATDFELLKGTVKEFAPYHLPERSFLYLLHALRDELENAGKLVSAPDWRMYLMRPADVERELLRLHQFRKLEYHAAGSLAQLTLPFASAREYAESMAA
jgi:bacteriophage exclusion system BrxA-like protein